ncbi:MAG: sugar transferase [Ignavibacteriales bacterium]
MVKRAFDIIFAVMCLVIASPLLLAIALAIKLDSKGPVFYRGLRVGLHGKPFRIYKFRSMVADAERTGVSSTSETDYRVTRCGRVLRKFKLDELPQLINVLIGDMSIVGPRPEVPRFVDMYTEEERAILTIRPGITDWASIRFHNEGEIIQASGIKDADEAYARLIRPEKMQLQMKYVKEHNVWLDFKIILATALMLFSTRVGNRVSGVEGSSSSGRSATQIPG